MRTFAFLTCLLILAPTGAVAQEATPIAEVAGGYSVLNDDDNALSGWVAAGSGTITRWFGVAAEAGINYYTGRFTWQGQEYEYSWDVRFAGVGPRFVARGRRVTGFGQLLVGALGGDGETQFAIQAGGGVDLWLARAIGIRAGIDGRGSWYEEEKYGSWRFHTGVVVALGTR